MFRPSRIDGPDSLAQVIVRDALPWGLACVQDHLHMDTSVFATSAGDREVETTTNSVNRLIGETPHHLQDNLDCWVTATGEDHQTFVLDSCQWAD